MSMANLSGDSFRSGAVRSIASIAFRNRCPVRFTNADHLHPALLCRGYGNIRPLHLDVDECFHYPLIISGIGLWHASAHATSTACETLSI